MTYFLRQSTASQEIPLGPFVDATDGNTAETGLTIANTDIKLFKTGASAFANKNSGGATHDADGEYIATLDATDTNTIGPLVIRVKVAGALAVRLFCVVLDEAVYDALFGTAALSTLTPAQVNAEVLDVINVDTYALPGQETPTATPTIAYMLRFAYKFLTNPKSGTSTLFRLFNRAGTTVDQKEAITVASGTTTRNGLTTGP